MAGSPRAIKTPPGAEVLDGGLEAKRMMSWIEERSSPRFWSVQGSESGQRLCSHSTDRLLRIGRGGGTRSPGVWLPTTGSGKPSEVEVQGVHLGSGGDEENGGVETHRDRSEAPLNRPALGCHSRERTLAGVGFQEHPAPAPWTGKEGGAGEFLLQLGLAEALLPLLLKGLPSPARCPG